MELNGFVIGQEIKTLFKIKVGAVIAEHPVVRKLAELISMQPFTFSSCA